MDSLQQDIRGYKYGDPALTSSTVTVGELALLKESAQFTSEDAEYLRLAGDVLQDRTNEIVSKWRSDIIASLPHLAKHSRDSNGHALPGYLAASNLRFEKWILDTCRRPYDQQWLDYQQEIARRHTSARKNQTDGVDSTDYVPLRDVLAFVAVMNQTIRPFLASAGHSDEIVSAMHSAWQKSLQLQIALWAKAYMSLEEPAQLW